MMSSRSGCRLAKSGQHALQVRIADPLGVYGQYGDIGRQLLIVNAGFFGGGSIGHFQSVIRIALAGSYRESNCLRHPAEGCHLIRP